MTSIYKQWKICVLLKNEFIFLKKRNIDVKLSQMMQYRLNQNAWNFEVVSVTRTSLIKNYIFDTSGMIVRKYIVVSSLKPYEALLWNTNKRFW